MAVPSYGPIYALFNAYFVISIILFSKSLIKDRKTLKGTQLIELDFLGFACCSGLAVGFLFGTLSALVLQTSAYVPVAHAASVLTLVLIVTYGISVYKILAVAVILRKIASYSLLSCYLVTVYTFSWFSFSFVLNKLDISAVYPANIVATLIVAYSMAPMYGRLQKVTNKLITSHSMDVSSTMKEAGIMFQSITTIDELLGKFSELLTNALRADNIQIFIRNNDAFQQRYSMNLISEYDNIALGSVLVERIVASKDPISFDTLGKARKTLKNQDTLDELETLQASLVSGIFSKSLLRGFVALGARRGGRVYDKTEQDSLQLLCNQFAVALENAQLYTQVQDSKIRNEIMLDQLVSGVIVADPNRRITLFNHEAQRITELPEADAVTKNISILPLSLYKALENALNAQTGKRNVDATLFAADENKQSVSIRMGTTFLFGHDNKPMGALLVFTDMTELKSLEEQVRRTDQLSSVGTLAAGMAHEIKNPLVTIKTFTQLLPQRYGDEDFRNEFSDLVAHEVLRIDGIVNELLSFSKPAKPHLVPMQLHDTIEQTLKLTHEQMAQNNITLNNRCNAKVDAIYGDAKLLSQAFINLYLNAVDAIGKDGTISVLTSNCKYRFANPENLEKVLTKKCIRFQISDTGKGIIKENIQKIFDPFFTSKSEGTGMGLSVSHGIISEHHGVIEVESEPKRGTIFNMYIPIREEAKS